MNPNDLQQRTYLGDGLYAGWDGYQIILHADRENQLHWVAMDPSVYHCLRMFARDLQDRLDAVTKDDEVTQQNYRRELAATEPDDTSGSSPPAPDR